MEDRRPKTEDGRLEMGDRRREPEMGEWENGCSDF